MPEGRMSFLEENAGGRVLPGVALKNERRPDEAMQHVWPYRLWLDSAARSAGPTSGRSKSLFPRVEPSAGFTESPDACLLTVFPDNDRIGVCSLRFIKQAMQRRGIDPSNDVRRQEEAHQQKHFREV
jgi:hypothetical protein